MQTASQAWLTGATAEAAVVVEKEREGETEEERKALCRSGSQTDLRKKKNGGSWDIKLQTQLSLN